MLLKVFAVRDLAVDAFMRPFFAPHLGMACRSFEDEAMREGSDMNKHAKDFVLYHLGEFDEDTGRFQNSEKPEMLVRASDILESKRVRSNGS